MKKDCENCERLKNIINTMRLEVDVLRDEKMKYNHTNDWLKETVDKLLGLMKVVCK